MESNAMVILSMWGTMIGFAVAILTAHWSVNVLRSTLQSNNKV